MWKQWFSRLGGQAEVGCRHMRLFMLSNTIQSLTQQLRQYLRLESLVVCGKLCTAISRNTPHLSIQDICAAATAILFVLVKLKVVGSQSPNMNTFKVRFHHLTNTEWSHLRTNFWSGTCYRPTGVVYFGAILHFSQSTQPALVLEMNSLMQFENSVHRYLTWTSLSIISLYSTWNMQKKY